MTPAPDLPLAPAPRPAASPWPGFPFPPPMMGIAPGTVAAASARWLREVAALLEGGEVGSAERRGASAGLVLFRSASLRTGRARLRASGSPVITA